LHYPAPPVLKELISIHLFFIHLMKETLMQFKTRSIVTLFTISMLFAVFFVFGLTHSASAAAESKKSFAVLPFEMHAPGSMAYLQEGLRDMLASRLAANGGAVIIEQSKVDPLLAERGRILQQQEATELAQQLAADYVITGSLTSLGGSMSLDAKIFAADETAAPLSFYVSAAEEKEVISAINQLSWDIAAKVLGVTSPAKAAQIKTAQPAPVSEDSTMAAFKTEHPDKVYKKQIPGQAAGMAPIIMTQSTAGTQGFTKTQNFDYFIEAMDIGDVDGDGKFDVVLADRRKVYTYNLMNNRLADIAVVEMPGRSKIHAVSVADLDNNGKAEIYISAADDYNPHSWAYEWNGSSMEMILNDIPWYIRVLDIPGEGPVLLGQRGGQSSLLLAGIFRLMKTDDTIQPEQRIVMPDYVNLFEFALADVNQDGAHEIIGINSADRLYVVKPNGSVLWVSDDYYGGTSRYIGENYDQVGRVGLDINSAHSSDAIGREDTGKRLYIPTRLIVMDVNGDGKDDIIVNKNLSLASRHVENYKRFTSSEIHAMSWNGIALGQIWQTKKIDGYIPDFQFLPLPGQQNRAKLFVSLVLSTGWTSSLTGGESTMLLYDVELAQEKKTETPAEN
jgi:TolB-like protein